MSRFVGNRIVTIDVGNGETVDLFAQIPYIKMQSILSNLSQENPTENIKMSLPLLKLAIAGWTLRDERDEVVPFTPDAVDNLDFETVTLLTEHAVKLYFPDKKKLEVSNG
jgi:hypothetical protein